ncbi:FAD-dependent monooxygenase [Actinoallomurus sp. CA-150999]|uniref:FAD-dependent monooxygenase n=1 Tax=Actinoallomurus sp. CA-150999 TaxID=3239887 RepID=UPI003D94FFEA
MTTFDTDFCVVGGGPGGLALALMLVRSGARVVVVERSASMNREYRGEILQPGGQMLLDQLGVLAGARRRGCHVHGRFRLAEKGRSLLDIDYRRLAAPYDHLLSIPQRHVLEELLDQCRAYAGFRYLGGAKAAELVQENGAVRGVRAGEHEVRAGCVIGADGRFSKVRRLAGIEGDRIDVFDFDVLWCKLPDPDPEPGVPDVRIFRDGGNPVIVYRSWPDSVQIGWTLPHRGYREIAARGFAHVKREIMRSVPPYAGLIERELTGMRQLSLLDVFAGSAREWTREGLVLIGDSAHTHSPLGAQGINLALQDAALLHPVLVGSAGRAGLREYERARRADIDTVMRLQVMQAKGMLAGRGPAAWLRPKAAGLINRTPIGDKILRRIAYGPRPISVRSDLFVSN